MYKDGSPLLNPSSCLQVILLNEGRELAYTVIQYSDYFSILFTPEYCSTTSPSYVSFFIRFICHHLSSWFIKLPGILLYCLPKALDQSVLFHLFFINRSITPSIHDDPYQTNGLYYPHIQTDYSLYLAFDSCLYVENTDGDCTLKSLFLVTVSLTYYTSSGEFTIPIVSLFSLSYSLDFQ